MHPVLAPDAIQVLEQNRHHLLADAERRRLVASAAPAAGTRPLSATAGRCLQAGLAGALAAVAPFSGLRRAPLSDEAAAIQSV